MEITGIRIMLATFRVMILGMISATIGASGALTANSNEDATAGAVEQSIPPAISQKVVIPPLHLSDGQRAKIRQALSSEHSDVSFALKAAKPAENFQPSVGATITKGLKPHPLPRPLIYQMPLLKRYTYLKFKNNILVINPMTRKLVEVFPQA
jgi:hypothetical protein